ncbi:uncharacterized protein DSM5745_06155 [Aspergillus mulundensis]|uniref:Uncharacterized protein n=1 Tax=Aspergillus mulundensis TaxID=1810919 RepID=A0A3D8RZ27_9EURO|nr:hypothetical protein DSM5745_06155 [Aspergillus mulundensis]RDW79303.1 hypothetical protein DSM5745_06155 [Aspergillus mulundensis]
MPSLAPPKSTSTRSSTPTKSQKYIRAHFCLIHLNNHLEQTETTPVTLEDASSAAGIEISRVGFVRAAHHAGNNGIELAFQPAFFSPLRSADFVSRGHTSRDTGDGHLEHLDHGHNKAQNERGENSGLNTRPRPDSRSASSSATLEQEQEPVAVTVASRVPYTPATPRLRPVSDASCSCPTSDSYLTGIGDIPALDLDLDRVPVCPAPAPRLRAVSDASCPSLCEQDPNLIGAIPTPVEDMKTPRSNLNNADELSRGHEVRIEVREVEEDETDTAHVRTANMQPGPGPTSRRGYGHANTSTNPNPNTNAPALPPAPFEVLDPPEPKPSALPDPELERQSENHTWITHTEPPAPVRRLRTAPLYLPHTPHHMHPNPGQLLFRNAGRLCCSIEDAAEEIEERPRSVSLGTFSLAESGREYRYPWAVGDVYAYVHDLDGSPHPNTIVTVLIGAGGTDEELCMAEFKAAVGVLCAVHERERGEGFVSVSAGNGPIAVLLLAYFGSGHGRIMQVYHDGENLNVQYSPLLTFDMKDKLTESLFTRYTAGRPVNA